MSVALVLMRAVSLATCPSAEALTHAESGITIVVPAHMTSEGDLIMLYLAEGGE